MDTITNNFYQRVFSRLTASEKYQDLRKYQLYWDDWEASHHRNLVSMLQNANSEAWEFIKLYSIRFYVFKANSRLLHLVHDLHWGEREEDELFSRLYEKMIVDGKITLYNYRGPVQFWMRWYIKEIISKEIQKKKKERAKILSQMQHEPAYYSENNSFIEAERRSHAQKCFAELWKDKPMQAYVLLLRDKVGLSSKKVAALLNHTNDANINQIHRRAFQELLSIAKNIREQE